MNKNRELLDAKNLFEKRMITKKVYEDIATKCIEKYKEELAEAHNKEIEALKEKHNKELEQLVKSGSKTANIKFSGSKTSHKHSSKKRYSGPKTSNKLAHKPKDINYKDWKLHDKTPQRVMETYKYVGTDNVQLEKYGLNIKEYLPDYIDHARPSITK